jgi:flagellar basal-body rod modification protein FlgD
MNDIQATQTAGGIPTSALAAPPRRNDQLGKDAFLKLLVAQLRYQDPLKPADPGDFMSQSAQFTSVEKLEELTRISASNSRSLAMSAAGNLIGRNVNWFGDDGTIRGGRVGAAMPSTDGIALVVGADLVPLDGVIRIG